MITLRKLVRLPEGTRQRKIVRVLEAVERAPTLVSERFLRDLLQLIAEDVGIPAESAAEARRLAKRGSIPEQRAINALRHGIMRALGVEPADWDLAPPVTSSEAERAGTGAAPAVKAHAAPGRADLSGSSSSRDAIGITGSARPSGLANVVIFAEDIRSPFNLGSIVRTAAAFGVQRLVATPTGAHFQSKRFVRSAMGAEAMVELALAVEPPETSGELIALETGGVPVGEFRFPSAGVLMVGSEELGLSPTAVSAASRRVSVPLPGAKGSLNVGVAVGIALSWWATSVT